MKDWTKYRKYPEVTVDTNNHQYVTDKPLKVSNYIENIKINLNCNTNNKFISSGYYLGFLKIYIQ